MADCERFELDMIDYLDGTLDGERLAMLKGHLRVCPACSHRLEMMRALMDETVTLCVDVPDSLHKQIMQRIARERKGGRLLRFAPRRMVAVAAAAVALVCAASVYGVSRLHGQKGVDTASLERQLVAENSMSSSTRDDAGSSGADAGDASMDGSFYAYDEDVAENGEILNDVAPAESDEADTPECDPEEFDSTLDQKQKFFSNIAGDTRYAAVVVMDAEEVPSALEEYTLVAADMVTAEGTNENKDEVFYTIVPADKMDEIVDECRAEEVKLMRYDTENPTPDAELLDASSDEALFILQITK